MKSRQSTSEGAYLCALLTIALALAPINAGFAKALDGSTCAETKPAETNGALPHMTEPRLLELFPELSSLLDATAFQVSNEWMGLSRRSPAELEVALALHDDRFEGEASVRFGVEKLDTFRATKRQVVVSRDAVRAFLCAALQAPLEERAYEPYRAHTDDYPDLNFTFQGQRGPLTIMTRSQAHVVQSQLVQTPWAIRYADRTFVVSAPDIDSVLEGLLPLLDFKFREQ